MDVVAIIQTAGIYSAGVLSTAFLRRSAVETRLSVEINALRQINEQAELRHDKREGELQAAVTLHLETIDTLRTDRLGLLATHTSEKAAWVIKEAKMASKHATLEHQFSCLSADYVDMEARLEICEKKLPAGRRQKEIPPPC